MSIQERRPGTAPAIESDGLAPEQVGLAESRKSPAAAVVDKLPLAGCRQHRNQGKNQDESSCRRGHFHIDGRVDGGTRKATRQPEITKDCEPPERSGLFVDILRRSIDGTDLKEAMRVRTTNRQSRSKNMRLGQKNERNGKWGYLRTEGRKGSSIGDL